MPDIDRLRRFALGVALVLVSYAAAGIHLDSGAKASVFGIAFTITNPELLPLGLILASCYALARFYYYGIMLTSSPYRIRKDLLHGLHADGGRGIYAGSVFFGPSKYSTTPQTRDKEAAREQLRKTVEAFPKVGKWRATGEVNANRGVDDEGDDYVSYCAEISIPLSCRIAAIVQDIDYTAPVWGNLCALTLAIFRFRDLG